MLLVCRNLNALYHPRRSHAIACVNQFIIGRAQALMDHIDTFIEVSCAFETQRTRLTLRPPNKSLIPCSWFFFPPPPPLLEPVCAGGRWRLWGEEERVPGPGHVTGGPHRPPHPPHAQHHPGNRWDSSLLDTHINYPFASGRDDTPSSLMYNDTHSSYCFWSRFNNWCSSLFILSCFIWPD